MQLEARAPARRHTRSRDMLLRKGLLREDIILDMGSNWCMAKFFLPGL